MDGVVGVSVMGVSVMGGGTVLEKGTKTLDDVFMLSVL